MKFEWDPTKELKNVKKHSIDFTEATTVFNDPLELTVSDPDHSVGESRFVSIDCSYTNRLLVVSYTKRGDNVRIISARDASVRERRAYESEQ